MADKISNLRSILSSPPPDWDYERKRQYFEWGNRVVDGLTAPNPVLKAEFKKCIGGSMKFRRNAMRTSCTEIIPAHMITAEYPAREASAVWLRSSPVLGS